MGLFCDIDYKLVCPYCCEWIKSFQSKSGPSETGSYKPWEVNNFYAECESCKKWVEYQRKPGRPIRWLDDFELIEQ